MSKHTTLLQDLRCRSKHFVVNTNSSCGVMWSVQSLIFADLGEDLGRAHWITPFVESKPGIEFGIKLYKRHWFHKLRLGGNFLRGSLNGFGTIRWDGSNERSVTIITSYTATLVA